MKKDNANTEMNSYESCEKMRGVIFAYIEGEIEENIKCEFEEHIKKCDDCRIELERCRKMLDSVRDSARIPSKDLSQSVLKKVRTRKVSSVLIKSASVIAAAVVLTFAIPIGLHVMHGVNGEDAYYGANFAGKPDAEEDIFLTPSSGSPEANDPLASIKDSADTYYSQDASEILLNGISVQNVSYSAFVPERYIFNPKDYPITYKSVLEKDGYLIYIFENDKLEALSKILGHICSIEKINENNGDIAVFVTDSAR